MVIRRVSDPDAPELLSPGGGDCRKYEADGEHVDDQVTRGLDSDVNRALINLTYQNGQGNETEGPDIRRNAVLDDAVSRPNDDRVEPHEQRTAKDTQPVKHVHDRGVLSSVILRLDRLRPP